MSRCYGCCQENCGYTKCGCSCHNTATKDVVRSSSGSSKNRNYAEGDITANTSEVWRRLVGETIIGTFVTYDQSKRFHLWIVTSSGAAFVINSKGAFWRASKEEVLKQVQKIKDEMDQEKLVRQDLLSIYRYFNNDL